MSLPDAPRHALWVGVVDAGGEHGGPHVVAVYPRGWVLLHAGAWTPSAGHTLDAHVAAVADMVRGIADRDARIKDLELKIRGFGPDD